MHAAAAVPFSRLWRRVLAMGVADALAYRGAFFLQAFFQLVPLVTALLLWSAVFETSASAIAGFTSKTMLSFYLVTNVLRLGTFLEDAQWTIPQHIRGGELNKFLVRPISYLAMEWHLRMGQVLVQCALLALPAAALFVLARSILVVPEESWRWAAFGAAVVLGVQIGFLVSVMIGFTAFWLLESSGFLHAIFPVQLLLSGAWLPLELLPPKLYAVLNALPWAYQTYFPMRIYLGRASAEECVAGLLGQIAWIAGLTLVVWCLWRQGLRRYAAAGG